MRDHRRGKICLTPRTMATGPPSIFRIIRGEGGNNELIYLELSVLKISYTTVMGATRAVSISRLPKLFMFESKADPHDTPNNPHLKANRNSNNTQLSALVLKGARRPET